MIVELKGIKFSEVISEQLTIRLKELRIDKTPQGVYLTCVTEEEQVLVLYLPEGRPFVEITST